MSDNHPKVPGDLELLTLHKRKLIPGNIDPKKKWAELSAAEQYECDAIFDMHTHPARKDEPDASAVVDKKNAETAAKYRADREAAHAKDSNVRLDEKDKPAKKSRGDK